MKIHSYLTPNLSCDIIFSELTGCFGNIDKHFNWGMKETEEFIYKEKYFVVFTDYVGYLFGSIIILLKVLII